MAVVLVEQPPPLQLRHQQVDNVVHALGNMSTIMVKPSAACALQPLLHGVRDGRGRPHDVVVRTGRARENLADREVLRDGEIDDALAPAEPFLSPSSDGTRDRKRPIQMFAKEVGADATDPSHRRQQLIERQRVVEGRLLALGLFEGLAKQTFMPGRILIDPDAAPCPSLRRRRSVRNALAPSVVCCAVNTTSANRAAWSRPAGEEPAWKDTGRPWRRAHEGQRPAHSEVLARVVDRVRNFLGSANTLFCLSPTSASVSQLSHSLITTSRNSSAAAVALRSFQARGQHLGRDGVGRRHAVPSHAALRRGDPRWRSAGPRS